MITNHLTWIFWLFICFNVSLHSYFIHLNANCNGYLVCGRDIRFKDDTTNINTNENNNAPPQSFKILVETTDHTLYGECILYAQANATHASDAGNGNGGSTCSYNAYNGYGNRHEFGELIYIKI
eukprot:478594_1